MMDKSKIKIEGIFSKEKKPDGHYIEYYDNSNKWEEGTYKNGKKEGTFTQYYETGEKWFEETFKNGEKVQYFWYFKNGKIDRVGNVENDMYHGPFIKYYENGNIEQEVIWEYDVPIKVTDYDETGNVID